MTQDNNRKKIRSESIQTCVAGALAILAPIMLGNDSTEKIIVGGLSATALALILVGLKLKKTPKDDQS